MNSRLAAMLFAVGTLGCAAIPYQTNCGLTPAGDFDNRFAPSFINAENLQAGVDAAISAAALTTAPAFNDQIENCRALVGYRVYTKQAEFYELGGRHVAGHTSCFTKLIVVARPGTGRWQASALVHELFHAMQDCKAELPVDPTLDEHHADWNRHGLYSAIETSRKTP